MSSSGVISQRPILDRANVLIVEDERIARQALAALMAASGYETEAAASAEEALEALRSGRRPHIALVDLDLPGMNGLEFIRTLREVEPSVFPVLITAANADNVLAAVDQRDVAYLPKPLDFESLLTLLSRQSMN